MRKFAEKRGECQPKTAEEKTFLAHRGVNVEGTRSLSLIFQSNADLFSVSLGYPFASSLGGNEKSARSSGRVNS